MSNLRKNSYWSLISIGCYATAQWWILSYMARQNKIDQIGYYSIALSITTPLVVFSNLNLRYLYVSDSKNEFTFSDYLDLRKIMFMTTLIVVGAIVFFSDYNRLTKFLILTVGVYKLVESVSDIFFGYHQKKENMKIITKSVLVRSLLIFTIFTICFYFTKDILICSIFIVCIYLTTLLGIDIRSVPSLRYDLKVSLNDTKKWHGNGGHSKKLFKLFKIGLPMGASLMIYSAVVAIPRFFIEKNIGIEELGIYTALYYLYSALLLIAIALADAALPRFTSYELADDQKAFWNLLYKYIYGTIVLIILGGILFWFFGSFLLKLAYGGLFAGYIKLFILGLFITGIEIINKFLAICMTAKRILILQPFLNLLSFINLAIICYNLNKNTTLFSVMAAQGITFGIQMVITMLILIKRKKKKAYTHADAIS